MTLHGSLRRPRVLAVAAATVMWLAGASACGKDATSSSGSTTAASKTSVKVTGAWARPTPGGTTSAAVYLTITAGASDDSLTGVAVGPTVASAAAMHHTMMAGDMGSMSSTTMGDMGDMGDHMSSTTMADGSGDMTSTTMAGAMEMQPVDKVAIPAHGKVEFKPGGYHVMLTGLTKPLKDGDSFALRLTFAHAGLVDTTVTVRNS